MYVGIKRWEGRDWFSFLSIFAFLALHLLLMRYPFLYWDSLRYLRAAVFLSPDPFSPTLVCYLIHPLVTLMGAYGFAVFQMALLTYVLVSALKFFRQNFIVGIVSIILSLAGYLAASIMMDIYTVVGLLALFLILHGEKDILLYTIAGICYIAHYENLFIFPLCALIYWVIFDRKGFRVTFLPIIIFFIAAVTADIAVNYKLEKNFRLFPATKYFTVAIRIMLDLPEVAESYAQERPDSAVAKYKKFYEYALTTEDPSNTLFWDWGQGLVWRPYLSREMNEFIIYAFKNHKAALFKNAFKNTYKFLVRGLPHLGILPHRKIIEDYVAQSFPGQLKYAKNSLQYIKKKPFPINFKFHTRVYYYIVYPVVLVFSIVPFINRRLRNSKYCRLAVFSLIVLLANAFIMSNFIDYYSRYFIRVMFIPCLATSLIVADIFKSNALKKEYWSS